MSRKFDKLDFAQHLADYHDFFRLFVDYGDIIFTDKIPTAAVGFNRDGNCISFMFNPTFWDESSLEKRIFIVCHEILHIFYNHGQLMKKCLFKDRANVAADLVINHNLETYFGLNRKSMGDWEKYCWVETIFKDRKDVKINETFHYYYKLLPEVKLEDIQFVTVDEHGDMGDVPEDFVRQILDANPEVLEDFLEKYPGMNSKEPGDSSTIIARDYRGKQKKKLKSWIEVIPKWVRLKETLSVKEDWRKPDNRYLDYLSREKDQFLPSLPDQEKPDRVRLGLFIDVSGSVVSYASIFIDAAKSIPDKYFDVKKNVHVFDTEVLKITLDQREFTGGGTALSPIEKYINKHYGPEFFDAVFVLTDGHADLLTTKYPERWHFFMVDGYSVDCIPKGAHIRELKDYFPLDKVNA